MDINILQFEKAYYPYSISKLSALVKQLINICFGIYHFDVLLYFLNILVTVI